MPNAPKTHGQSMRERYPERYRETKRNTVAVRVRNSVAWQRFRAWYKAEHPLCEECLKHGRVTATEDVHHIVPINVRPDLALDQDNVLAVCRACHGKMEA